MDEISNYHRSVIFSRSAMCHNFNPFGLYWPRGVVVLPAVVIDDRGEIWPLGSPELRAHLPHATDNDEVAGYTVRHLGFVLVRQQGRRLRAAMRPALVKPATLIALYYCIIDRRPEQIVLSRLEGEHGWHEVFDDLAEFAATVEHDIEDEGLRRHRPLYAMSAHLRAHGQRLFLFR